MPDTYNKKEREKKKKKKQLEKEERRRQKKLEGKKPQEFVYIDEFGNFTDTPPDPTKRKEVSLEEIVIGVPKREETEGDNLIKGVVKFFNEEKNFGFISDEFDENYFVHGDNTTEPIQGGSKVYFEAGSGPKGLIALNVILEKTKKKLDKQAKTQAQLEAQEEAEIAKQIEEEE